MKSRIARFTRAAALLAGLFSSTPAWTSPLGASPPDIKELLHFALMNSSIRYETTSAITAEWAQSFDDVNVVMVPQTRNRYFIATNDNQKVQEIAIRGTVNLRNLLYDLRFQKTWDPTLGVRVHRGFDLMAHALYADIGPRLVPGYTVRISGQSLGAAEALLLAMLLSRQGVTVDRVVTFGQPKVTDAEGAKKYGYLPLVRVVDQNDIVALLPPKEKIYPQDPYVQFGSEIDLLEGAYFCRAPAEAGSPPLPASITNGLSLDELSRLLREHNIMSYVSNLRRKLAGTVEVPYADRALYVAPQFR